jgi:hypothetical protein
MRPTEYVLASFTLPSPSVTLHEPILVDFSIQNGRAEPIRFDLGPDRKDHFEFSILALDGSSSWAHHREVDPDPAGRAYALGAMSLRPEEVFHTRLLLDEWLSFDRPGRYEVGAALADTLWTEAGASLGRPRPEVLSIRVGRRSAKRLAQVCESLSTVAAEALGTREGHEATVALSYVRDPIAVPYLERALVPGGSACRHVLHGLGRIGTAEAAAVLRSVHRSWREPGARSLARTILRRIEKSPSKGPRETA